MSDTESKLKSFWDVEEKENKEVEKTLYDQLKFLGKRISVTLLLGSIIEDFANMYFKLNLCYNTENADKVVREAFTRFFYSPTSSEQSISSQIKAEIESIPDVKSIDEIIDRFAKVYATHCRLVEDDEDFDDYLARGDKAGLELLLSRAPDPKNYDRQLHKILVSHFEK